MIIERSADFGHTWRPYRYFASNCTRTFPGIRANALHHINDIICEERYSDIEPSTNGEVGQLASNCCTLATLKPDHDTFVDRHC